MDNQPKKRRTPRKKERPEADFFDLLRRGAQALHQGKIGTAMELLEHAHDLDPENEDVMLNLGGAYILSKKFKKAVTLLEPLAERDPDNPMIWTNLGAAYLGNPVLAKDENQQQAIAAFKRAIDLNPEAPNVAYNIGLIYRDRKEIDEAIHWFQQAVKTKPNDKDAIHYLVQLTEQAKGDEAT